jgi:hypothetical protein
MKQKILYLIILLNLTTPFLKAQTSPDNPSQILEKLYSRLVNNYVDNDRIRINDSITAIVESYVKSDSVFNHRFTNLRYLGQITSPDSLIKIVTWNLVLGDHPGRYFCYIIRKQDSVSQNLVCKLTTNYTESPVKTDTLYYKSDWYGALYYDMKPYMAGNNKCWILLGIDYGNPLISRKIIDVLSFSKDGSTVFGKKWFVSGEELKYRDVFEYASNGMMSLRFRTESLIVFDHLVPFTPAAKNDRQFYGPDYSYDAYSFKDGRWNLMINIEVRNKE